MRGNPAADDRPAAGQDALAEAARGHQALEHGQLPLPVHELLFERVERDGEVRHCGRTALEFLAVGTASRRWLVEVELAAVEAREVGDAAADRIEADQVGIERADARGERIDAALHLVAHRLEIVTLLVDLARDGGTIERPGDEATDLQARTRTARPPPAGRLAAAIMIVFGCVRSNWSTRPVRPDTMCRFIAALTLFAAVKHDAGASAEDCAASHINPNGPRRRQLRIWLPTVRSWHPGGRPIRQRSRQTMTESCRAGNRNARSSILT